MGAENNIATLHKSESSTTSDENRFVSISVKKPHEVIEELKELLPGAKKVDMLFLNAIGGDLQPLGQLVPYLKQVGASEGKVRIGVSGPHRRLFPQGKATLFYRPGLTEKKADAEQKELTDMSYASLRESGVNIIDTEAFGINPRLLGIANNVHSKWIRIERDEKVITYLPEFNLDNHTVAAENFALRFEETPEKATMPGSLSSVVGEYLEKVMDHKRFSDYETQISDTISFLADAGKPGKSLIRDKAVTLFVAETTQDILFVSQFPPAGAALDGMIKAATEGKPVILVLSDGCKGEAQKGFVQRRVAKIFESRVRKLDTFYTIYYPGKVHSKWAMVNTGIQIQENARRNKIVIDEPEQPGKGIASSNNLHPAGYGVGTGESGLFISDQSVLHLMRDALIPIITKGLNEEGELPDFTEKLAS